MKSSLVDQVVEAVLYEGYILYPYRASSKKNRQRFTFGRVYPQAYSEAERGAEPCLMQTQCLARGPGSDGAVQISVRFLHPMTRQVGVLTEPLDAMPAQGEPAFQVVPELRVQGKLYLGWNEAVEREVAAEPLMMRAGARRRVDFSFPESRALEPVREADGKIVAVIVRRQEALAGTLEIAAEPVDANASRLTVQVQNRTPMGDGDLRNPDAVLARTFASTHTILRAEDAEFISLLDMPGEYAEAAAECKNIGTWPVLVGEEGSCETMLSSPIILYDYPKIAPESAGDLFDGTEIDEILTLRIKTMTDEEKSEMRGVDEYARRILERAEAMPDAQLLGMHGAMRKAESPAGDDFFNPATRLEGADVRGTFLKAGDRVRICPKGRADVMDFMLEGKAATIEAVEQDVEGRVHFALVVEEDPGRDLGMMRQPGHRFFYAADEVEPLGEEA